MSEAFKVAVYFAVAFPLFGGVVVGIVASVVNLAWFAFITVPLLLFCGTFCIYKLCEWTLD